MKEIVCDTNIWYDLSENYIVENARLIPTFCNVFELTHSENLVKRFDTGIKAIKTLYSGGYLENHYWLNPAAHVMLLESGSGPRPPEELVMLDLFFQLAEDKISQDEFLENRRASKNTELKEIANFFNTMLDKNIVTIPDNKFESIEWTRDFIGSRVHEWAETKGMEYHMNTKFDWSLVELFLNVLALFLRKKVFLKMKFQPNDMFDLWNMVYVKPGNLYWTKEGQNTNKLRWHTLIKEAGMEHYLYIE